MIKIEIMTLVLVMISLCIQKKHTLRFLITLEIYCLIVILITIFNGYELFYSMIILCVGACEGGVGLGIIASIRRMKNGVIVLGCSMYTFRLRL